MSDEDRTSVHDAPPPHGDVSTPGGEAATPVGEERWRRANEEWLSAALEWIRLLLRRFAEAAEAAQARPEPEPEPEPDTRGGWFLQRRREERPRLALPAGDTSATRLDEARARMDAAAKASPPPALHVLGDRLGLTPFEREALLLCVAVELDPRVAGLCSRAQRDPARAYPTFALALALFDDPAWDALAPERPLRHWRLLEISQPGAEPLTTSPLRADERIVSYVKGLNYLDDRLTTLLVPFDAAPDERAVPSQAAARAAVERALRPDDGGSPRLVQLVGTAPLSKQLVAQQAAAAAGLSLFRLPVELLPGSAGELETLSRLWQRESVLLPVAVYLDAHEREGTGGGGEGKGEAGEASLRRFLGRTRGIFLLGTREVRAGLAPGFQVVEVEKPTALEQRGTWADELGREGGEGPALLAGQFDLDTPAIRGVARAARIRRSEDATLEERLWDGCLMATAPGMDRLAQRIHPVATWDDIVLPDEEMALLRQLAAQVAQRTRVYDEWGFRRRMNRGLGIHALFAGESGTGKTMAAEVLANHLRLHLYRIDLSAVVSKYIGETEKNLRRLFDAAEDGGAILFFDEADALFGKRSEVKDSHDRYANIEVSYLLQRMEAYRGLSILATNMRGALDDAFLRRLRFVITFPFPGRPERRAIWQRAWPAETPRADMDEDHLARLSLTGGNIANVALNAAFMAAEKGTAVSMPLVLDAARAEYRKLDRALNEVDFAWTPPPAARPVPKPAPAPVPAPVEPVP